MTIFSRWISAFGIILAVPSSAWAQTASSDWPVSSAPARFTIEEEQVGTPMLSWVRLCLPNPKWADSTVRVCTDAGVPVGSDMIWTAPGEPTTFVFDSSSGSKRYYVFMGSDWPAMHLADTKAGVWLESRVGDGKYIANLPDMLQSWNQSKTVVGRALLPSIYEGGNRFGPQGNLLEHFQGWFETDVPEHLGLAVSSDDAAFVLVDGKEVAEWPGKHNRDTGAAGPPQGAVDLAAGVHMVDYYNDYVASDGGNPPLMCCLVAKGGSLGNWTMLQPSVGFFRPIGIDHPVSYELQSSGGWASETAPALAMNWVNQEQSVIFTDIPDIGLIGLKLTCLATPPTGTLTWTFDDGTTADGPSVTHLFPRPGMRTVKLTLKDGDTELATLSQTINVHPDWEHAYKQPDFSDADEADITGRDPAALSAPDLASCFAVFCTFQKPEDLLKFLPAVCAKMKAMSDADLPYLKDAALYLVREDWTHFAEESQLLRALVDRSATAQPTPQLTAMTDECRLALARLTLKTSDRTDEVRSLLDAIKAPALTGDQPRVYAILQADLAMATGDVAGAKKQYETLTGEPSGPDERSSIRPTAKIGQARAFLDRKDFEAAEDSLNEVAWQAPIEKMSSEWALTRLRLYQEEDLPVVAYLWAKRLMPVITESGRSELLFRLTDLAFAQGDKDLAHKTLVELLKKHPYSEQAAQAKEKWPGQT